MTTTVTAETQKAKEPEPRKPHPIRDMLIKRSLIGVLTLLLVSILVFAATQTLPGNAASAVLLNTATPQRLHALEVQLGLNQPAVEQYWTWLTGILHGNFGKSLANGMPVGTLVGGRILNSLVLVVLAGVIGTLIGVGLGVLAAARRDSLFDHVLSVTALGVTALPEFVVAVVLIIFFAAVVWHLFPAVSVFVPGTAPWSNPKELVLPVATLVIVIVPYVFRMMRASMIDALESDYVQMAQLKGVPRWRILLFHALPNAIAPTIQVIGLSFLYLAGGVVVVEYMFNYPGLGQALVSAVSDRDIPQIQFIVLILAAFYIVVNILTDVISLAVSPRRRLPVPQILTEVPMARRPEAFAVLGRAVRTPRGVTGLVIGGCVVLVAAIGPVVAPYSSTEFVTTPFARPTSVAWLGGDVLGRDVLSRTLDGGWELLVMAAVATALGVIVGAASA